MNEAEVQYIETQDAEIDEGSFEIAQRPTLAARSLSRDSCQVSLQAAEGAVLLLLPFSRELTAEEIVRITATP